MKLRPSHRLSRVVAFAAVLLCVGVVARPVLAEPAPVAAAEGHAGRGVPASGVSFLHDIKPLFEASCIQCHAKGRVKGGLSLETREALLKGGDSGPAMSPGHGGESLIVKLVAGDDPDSIMPKKGSRWKPEQVAALKQWIDEGAIWDSGVTFAKAPSLNLARRTVALPGDVTSHPVDRILSNYWSSQNVSPSAELVDDRLFARRAWLDAIGLLPPPSELDAFLTDPAPDKRAKLVRRLLSQTNDYADHWLTFWNDLLRNDYTGTGYIDGGRRQITGWLYSALLTNKPYDAFVREVIAPTQSDAEGFTKGIVWRGTVPAAMSVPMQAAQNVSQVFLGVNLKCAGCHDSFVSDWTLADAYGLAAVFSEKPLEMVHCDRPTGQTADARFLYPQIGGIDPKLSRGERLARFSQLITSEANGRLSRNVVNRLWSRLLGHGLVEPLDDMDKPAFCADLLDWLAEDLAANKYDLKHTIEMIMTSRAYQMPVVEPPHENDKTAYVFKGPHARRLSAEQFADAVSTIGDDWDAWPRSIEIDYSARGKVGGPYQIPAWCWTDEPVTLGVRRSAWQIATAKTDAAQKAALAAQNGIDGDSTEALAASEKAKAAAESAAKFAASADAVIRNPEQLTRIAAGKDRLDDLLLPLARHNVGFRKTFELKKLPQQAMAIVAASQQVKVYVNGKNARAVLSDRRTELLDIKSLLKEGANLVAVEVDSHTERPGMQAADRDARPAVFNHLNERSGVAFAATLIGDDKAADDKSAVQWALDDTWKTRRAPDTGWQKPDFNDEKWSKAMTLPSSTPPMDEGLVIDDSGTVPTGALKEDLAVRLPGLLAFTTRSDHHVRAALQTSNPLELALGRPNREMVMSVRQDAATTIQALELTNGATLDDKLKVAGKKLADSFGKNPAALVKRLYGQALCRLPSDAELSAAAESLGEKPSAEAVSDLLWAVIMQPEFQFVH